MKKGFINKGSTRAWWQKPVNNMIVLVLNSYVDIDDDVDDVGIEYGVDDVGVEVVVVDVGVLMWSMRLGS